MVMEDFIGFTYNGVHSSDLKIYRTSNSNRYDDNITATMIDKTVDVPGGDGQYYFGTTFKNRTFAVNYAFHNLEESDIAKIKEVFCGDGIHDLVFDEHPYKAWHAKVTGTASMKHLCFEESGKRIYKGEGSITFTCYYPYAHTPTKLWAKDVNHGNMIRYMDMDGKILENYDQTIYTSKNEWASTSKINEKPIVDDKIYIKGELPTSIVYTICCSTATNIQEGKSYIQGINLYEHLDGTETKKEITFLDKQYVKQDTKIIWDTKTGLCTRQDGTSGEIKIIPYTGTGVLKVKPGYNYGKTITSYSVTGAQLTLDYQALYR